MAYIAPVNEVVMPVRQMGASKPRSRRNFVFVQFFPEFYEACDAFWLIERLHHRLVASLAAHLQETDLPTAIA